MRRRTLFLAGAGIGLPAIAAAQPRRVPRVGFLSASNARGNVAADFFRRYLAALGWRDGETVLVDERNAEGDPEAARRLAGEIVAARPDLIVVTGVTEARLAAGATQDIPIVFLQVVDPVGLGIVASLARPGGNVTGVAATGQMLWGKRIEVLAELTSGRGGRLGVLANPANSSTARSLEDIARHAARHGFETHLLPARRREELASILADLGSADALLVQHDFLIFPARSQVVEAAAAARRPAVYENRFSPMIGGLASYGADLRENFRQGAIYADRILRGARPSDLPVVQPSRLELVVNLAALAQLGQTAPPALLARADEVLE